MPPRSRRLHRFDFLLDPLNRASPEPKRLGDLQDANALLELLLRLAFQRHVDLGLPEPRPLCHGTFEACLDPLPDHRSLELGKGTADLKHKLSHWRPQCLGTAALVEAFR